MTFPDPQSTAAILALQGALSLAFGAALGAAYFLSLRHNVVLFASTGSLIRPLMLLCLRFVILAAALGGILVLFNALSLIIAVVGLLAARTVLLNRELA